jgi:hypothetical protein
MPPISSRTAGSTSDRRRASPTTAPICASLQVPGMGFAALPDVAAMTPVEDWTFASLGQEG